jgi:hypothetical protein
MNHCKLLTLSLIALSFFSCQKESSNDDESKSPAKRMELITKAPWIYHHAGLDMNGDNTGETAIPSGYLEDCDLDNIITLNADGSGTVDEGATKCDAGAPQSYPLTWEFKDNANVVTIPNGSFGPLSGDAIILELTETKLKLKKDVTIPLLNTVIVIVELKHP